MLIVVTLIVVIAAFVWIVAITEFFHKVNIMDLKSFGTVAGFIVVGIMTGVILTLIVLAFLSGRIFSG